MTDKKENVRNILKDRRKELGYTMKELAEKVGVSEATISRWESGDIANMKRNRIVKLSNALEISPAVVMGWTDVESDIANTKAAPLLSKNRAKIPVLGSIPAGTPLDAIQDIQGYVDVPITWVDNHGALVVHGESMSPKYLDGDIVIFKEQPDCESGQDCVVYVNGYDATLKKVIKTETGIILQPINPDYEPVVCGEDYPATILGVVVELRRRV